MPVGLILSLVGSKLWGAIKSLSFWQLVCIALVVLVIVQHFELVHARSEANRWHKQAEGLSEKLQQISDKRNEQKIITRDRIKVVTQTIHDADQKAKVIETAPLPGGCKSPKEVMDADV